VTKKLICIKNKDDKNKFKESEKMSNKNKKRIAVLVSGGGSNLQSIIDNIEQGNLNCEISYVIADRECYGLERAEKHGIKNVLLDRKVLKEKLSDEISSVLENDDEKTDYIVLAGYLSILSPEFIKKWSRKIINIHPSLLPKFGGKGMYGMNVHRAVIEAKETESGCTIHFVDTGVDTGEIILQMKVPVLSDDTPEILQKRVLEKEHVLLIEGIKKLLGK
jgi:phosphoribosylglycinamide formyltransferase